MAITLNDIRDAREWGVHTHRLWKSQIRINDATAAGDWQIIWDDDTLDSSDPLVENVYLGALEDKIAIASATTPSIFVPPPPNTSEDRGEVIAQKRKRVYSTYWDRSDMIRLRRKLFMDWFHTGAAYMTPWTNWFDATGSPIPSNLRAPYLVNLDPRQAFPLAHDNRGNLIKVVFIRQRRVASLKNEYGANHSAFTGLQAHRRIRGLSDAEFLEEVWYFDSDYWAVAVADSLLPKEWQGRQILPDSVVDEASGSNIEWLSPPVFHHLGRCPVVENKRQTHDDSYRGAIEDVIPQLKVAQNFMARLLEDLESNIAAPVVLDNIENAEEYGPGAILKGTGDGRAAILRDRPPVNFEAQQTVANIMDEAHRQAKWPVQRSGQPDASIISGKGVQALAGAFNSELAWAQQDMERTLKEANSITAAFDTIHCAGEKKVFGIEGQQSFSVKYDPVKLFDGDYRNEVSYGDSTGLDESTRLTKLAILKNMNSMSTRTFLDKTGAVDDPLEEEREIAIESLTQIYLNLILPQRIEQGDLASLKEFVELIDTGKETVRSAVLKTIANLTEGAAGPLAGEAQAGEPDAIQMMRSLASGGIPGNAAGLPAPPTVGPELQRALPGSTRRLVSESAPGGTAA